MATSVRKQNPPAKRRTRRKPTTVPKIDLGNVGGSDLEMKGGRLVVRLSRDQHPEVFDLQRLIKQVRKVITSYQRKKKTRDVVHFLTETEKGLQIILKNHLEDAMRRYLK